MGLNLYLDDERSIPPDYPADTILCRTVKEALDKIVEAEYNISMISFDHDLGGNWIDGYNTGYDLACHIERMVHEGLITKPFKVYIHSQNPVGKQNIKAVMRQVALFFQNQEES